MSVSQELHEVFNLRRPVTRFLANVLRPLVCMMLRLGVSSYAVTEIVRWLYVDIAMRHPEFAPGKGMTQTKSRAALLTGLSRREVLRLVSMPNPDSGTAIANYSRTARVVSGWLMDSRYGDSKGKPLELPVKANNGPSFFGLVNDYAGDIPYRTVLEELRLTGIITQDRDQNLRLNKKALQQDTSNDKTILDAGEFAETLLVALDHDMGGANRNGTSHRLVYGHRVSPEKANRLRKKLVEETGKFTNRIEKFVDDSSSGQKRGAIGKQIGIGVYYFES